MCSGIEARHEGRVYRATFEGEQAAFPVMLAEGGEVRVIKWGRRKKEKITGPQGGWARQATVITGGWDYLSPRRGLGLVDRFMVGKANPGMPGRRLSQWIEVPKGLALECLIVGEGANERVYIVTTSPPERYRMINDKWPVMSSIDQLLHTPPPEEALPADSPCQ